MSLWQHHIKPEEVAETDRKTHRKKMKKKYYSVPNAQLSNNSLLFGGLNSSGKNLNKTGKKVPFFNKKNTTKAQTQSLVNPTGQLDRVDLT